MSKYQLLINGELVDGDATLDVLNPATEEVFATCSRGSEEQLNQAVAAAKGAFDAWSEKSIDERKQVVLAMADVLEANAEELAQILVQEQGKPLADATGEVYGTAAFFRYFTTLNLDAEVMEDSDNRKVEAHRKPLGVVGAILPWNFPLLLLGFKLPSALIAGNTVVVKPAPTTPLATPVVRATWDWISPMEAASSSAADATVFTLRVASSEAPRVSVARPELVRAISVNLWAVSSRVAEVSPTDVMTFDAVARKASMRASTRC